MKTSFLSFLVLSFTAWASTAPDVKTVPQVELSSYVGLWNELYRIPNSFQDNTSSSKSACFDTTAEYAALEDGAVSVTNTCNRIVDGESKREVAVAVAKILPDTGNSKLVVNFTGIGLLRWLGVGNGDYWILGLGPINTDKKYSWAIVGNPTRKYGWILSRKPTLSKEELEKIFGILEANGYSRSQFTSTQRAK